MPVGHLQCKGAGPIFEEAQGSGKCACLGESRVGPRPSFTLAFALLAWACLPGAAFAQGLGFLSGGSDPLDGTLAEREPVLETLDTSFVREQLVRLEAARRHAGDAFVPFDSAEHLNATREAYLGEASAKLYELQGDGSLTLGEVAGELPAIRESHLRRFENIVEARSRGYPPPPLGNDFDTPPAHAAALTRYTLLTRNPPGAWGKLALCAGIGVLLALVLARSLRSLSRRVSDHEYRALGSALDSIRVPLILAAMAGGLLVGLRFLWLPAAAEESVRTLLTIAIVALAFLGCWNLCDEVAGMIARGVRRATGRESMEHARRLIQRALRVLVIVAFLVIVSRFVLGVSLTGMLAGLGVIGVGLWILTRGLVENVAASFTLFGDRVFRIGDTVIHQGEWGTIEDIGFRSTRCRTFDGHMLHIPNRNLVDDTIRNVSARPYLRRRFRLSLVYGTPPDKLDEAMDIVRSVIEEHGDEVNREQGVNVVFDTFGEHDLQLLIQYYTASDDYWTAKETMSRINRGLLHRFDEADIAFAFPTQTTLLGTDGDAPLALRIEGDARTSDAIPPEEDGAESEPAESATGGANGSPANGEPRRRDGFDERAAEEEGDGGRGDDGAR